MVLWVHRGSGGWSPAASHTYGEHDILLVARIPGRDHPHLPSCRSHPWAQKRGSTAVSRSHGAVWLTRPSGCRIAGYQLAVSGHVSALTSGPLFLLDLQRRGPLPPSKV